MILLNLFSSSGSNVLERVLPTCSKPFSLEDDLHLSTTQPSLDTSPKINQTLVRKSARIRNICHSTSEPKNSRSSDQACRYSECRVVLIDVLKAGQEKEKSVSTQNKMKAFIDQVKASTTIEKSADSSSPSSTLESDDMRKTVDFEAAKTSVNDVDLASENEDHLKSKTGTEESAESSSTSVETFHKLTLSKMKFYFQQDSFSVDSS